MGKGTRHSAERLYASTRFFRPELLSLEERHLHQREIAWPVADIARINGRCTMAARPE
jgi:hypothetical protein